MQERYLDISAEFYSIITAIPEANALLTQLTQEHGYILQKIADWRSEAQKHEDATKKIGVIVKREGGVGGKSVSYDIENEKELLEVLKSFLSPTHTNAPHSPPVERSYQGGDGEKQNPMRMSQDGVDAGKLVETGAPIEISGLEPESKSLVARWCSWFRCCCNEDDEQRNPLLSSAPSSQLK